jgi:hypothetical protein
MALPEREERKENWTSRGDSKNAYFGLKRRNNNTLKKIYKDRTIVAAFKAIHSGLKVGSSHDKIEMKIISNIKSYW